jgi:histidyl-tRNA synthetase
MDRLGPKGVRMLLGEGRKDESGDFTKGAGLSDDAASVVLGYVSDRVDQPESGVLVRTKSSESKSPLQDNGNFRAGMDELIQIRQFCQNAGYGEDRILIDQTVVRGLEYYTGPVYEVELTFEVPDEKGRPIRFGSVGGGGRYDGLVSRFRGEPVPATGFSIGVSRLQAALTALGKISSKAAAGPVVVTVFGGEIADYQKLVTRLRQADIRAEMYLGNPKHSLGQQMKYADKRNSPCAIIQGSDEKSRGEVLIKDLIVGAEIAGATVEREDYLKKQAEAQFAVREEQLVHAVRGLLNKHGISH